MVLFRGPRSKISSSVLLKSMVCNTRPSSSFILSLSLASKNTSTSSITTVSLRLITDMSREL